MSDAVREAAGSGAVTPASWSILATVPDEAAARRLEAALERLGPAGLGVFELEDGSGVWEVGAHLDAAPDPAAVALLEAALGVRLVVSEVPPTDWVAHVRRELSPVEAGRFWLHGSHDAHLAADARARGLVPLLVDAAMAFGTGHHGTTLGCLRALDRLVAGRARAPVLDLGCGTAVLAMAAARVLEGPVVASDMDPVAVETARANLAANGLAGRVACVEADGVDHAAIRAAAPYGLILANILLGPLLALAPGVAALLAPGGRVVLSGLLVEQADAVERAYAARGLAPLGREDLGEWTTLVLGAPG